MKFRLYDNLLHSDSVMSHVFLNSISKDQAKQFAAKYVDLSKDEKSDVKIDITMTIEGVETSPEKFFETMRTQYFDHVERVAKDMFLAKTMDMTEPMHDKLQSISAAMESVANTIDWNAKEFADIKHQQTRFAFGAKRILKFFKGNEIDFDEAHIRLIKLRDGK